MEVKPGAEHPAEHGVGLRGEDGRVDDEAGVVHDERDLGLLAGLRSRDCIALKAIQKSN